MTDRDDIPEKIILENGDRARRGDDPLVHVREDDFSTGTKVKIGEYFQQMIPDKTNSSVAAIQDGPNLGVFVNNDPSSNAHLQKQTTEIQASFEKVGVAGYFQKDVIPGNAGDIDIETQIQASNLLAGLNENPELFSGQISDTIKENSLQSPDDLYVPGVDGQLTEDEAGTREHVLQSRLGGHSPKRLFGIAEKDPTISIKKLRNIGYQILLEASGEHYIPEDLDNVRQELATRAITQTAPGTARLGFRVNANRFSAEEMLNKSNDFSNPGERFGLKSGAKASFGSVNNPFVPFSAISSATSSIIVGTLLVKTFSVIFLNLAKSLSKFSPRGNNISPWPDGPTDLEVRRKRLGSNLPKEDESDPNFGLALLGLNENLLVATQNKYDDAVRAGLEVFFGSNITSGVKLGSAPTKIVESPGYYNGILRLLVRSIADPLSSILSIGPRIHGDIGTVLSNGPADYQPITGPASDPTTISASIRLIKESRFLKFMNVMANIGDLVLSTEYNSSYDSTIDNTVDFISENKLGSETNQTSIVPNPSALIKKNRLSDILAADYKNTMAWNANTLPALYMINSSIMSAESGFGNTNKYNILSSRRNFVKTDNKRLSADFVKKTEERLDSYYMPFYFHDLRTNEIISFHAFIDNISDSHSADYNESEGYGRIGKIYTYKNTNRAISLSFKTVATNQAGFDVMWYKLNKILMMLYPQYTLGRALSHNGKKFIQPFSQLPSSSPMIRLRVGDLIKSNFNEFDLARLFGLGSRDFDVTDGVALSDRQTQDAFLNEYKNIRDRQLGISTENNLPSFNIGEQFKITEAIQTIGNVGENKAIRRTTDPHAGETRQQRTQRQHAETAAIRAQRRNHAHGNLPTPPQIQVNSIATVTSKISDSAYRITFTPGLAGEAAGTIYEIDFRPQQNTQNYQSIRFDINKPVVEAAAAANVSPTTQSSGTPDDEPWRKISQFFSPDDIGGASTRTSSAQGDGGGNPIFKSFESTKGQGLAGFIKSIRFNWEGAIWETEDQNSKAPKWCTVELEFAPVHDLNPGIDVNGNMISPIYNVGAILQEMKIRRAEESSNENASTTSNNSQAGNI